MSRKPIFRLLADDPKLPLSLRALSRPDAGAENGSFGLDFNFTYFSVRFHGHLEQNEDGASLDLTGPLGSLPFSAESTEARAAILAILAAANAREPGCMALDKGRLLVRRRMAIAAPVTGVALVAALVAALVFVKPYLVVIATYLVMPEEAAKPGASRVRLAHRHGTAPFAAPRRPSARRVTSA